jgi:short-subunit dehydrogenase
MSGLQKYGPWAVITGGSEGIGASAARKLAAEGVNIVLIARKVEALDLVAREIRETTGVEVRTGSIDLANYDAIAQVRKLTDDVDVGFLFYNAGANKIRGNFIELAKQDYRDLIGINVINQADFLHHYGSLMKPRGGGGDHHDRLNRKLSRFGNAGDLLWRQGL